VNYIGDSLIGNIRNYEINFKKVNKENQLLDEFTTYPSALYSKDFTKIEALNPGNERKLSYDVFTAAAPPQHMQDIEIAKAVEDSLKYLVYTGSEGEQFEADDYSIKLSKVSFKKEFKGSDHGNETKYDLSFSIPMTIVSKSTKKEYHISPGLGVKESLIFSFPEVIDELGIKIKIPESEFSKIFNEDSALNYEEFKLKEGDEIQIDGFQVKLKSFDRKPVSAGYIPEEGDIALAAVLEIRSENNEMMEAKPIFILRGNQQMSVKDYLPKQGIHLRFTKINPQNEEMSFQIAREIRDFSNLQFMIAEDVPRSDILIVESNVFPGINLVWLGCLSMLFGLLLSYFSRRRSPTD
jgi:cytochrome c-type biogenesis protein CcmF